MNKKITQTKEESNGKSDRWKKNTQKWIATTLEKDREGILLELLSAIENEDIKKIKHFLKQGVDVNMVYKGKETALARAVNRHNFEIIDLLLSKGADPYFFYLSDDGKIKIYPALQVEMKNY